MLEFILTVSLAWEQCCDTYIGTFRNCEQAQTYYDLVLSEQYGGMSCLHQDYVMLPQGFEHNYVWVTSPIEVYD